MDMNKINRFAKKKMTFEEFKKMAKDENLSKYEKIGFPEEYRKDYERNIFKYLNDVLYLERDNITICDIGCGCSDLPHFIIENSIKYNQRLYLIDSKEMLDNIDLKTNYKNIFKMAGKFPIEVYPNKLKNNVDVVIIYSVLQHIFLDMNPFYFLDKAVSLLKENGRLLIGDIPNISKRNRFFASNTGIRFHQEFTKSNTLPEVKFNTLYEDKIDDGIIFAILMRYRNAGYETYLLEQPDDLPFSNRREDILIVKH